MAEKSEERSIQRQKEVATRRKDEFFTSKGEEEERNLITIKIRNIKNIRKVTTPCKALIPPKRK